MSNQQGGFSLFPNPNTSKPPSVLRNQTPRGRRSESRERRAPTPQNESSSYPLQQENHISTMDQSSLGMHPTEGQFLPPTGNIPQDSPPPPAPSQAAPPLYPLPPAGQFGESAQGPTTSHSNVQNWRRSIAKLPLYDEHDPAGPSHPPMPLQSIFPTYNHAVPLAEQDYAPTQLSPTRIPRGFISRPLYQQRDDVLPTEDHLQEHVGVALGSPMRSPMSATMHENAAAAPWRRPAEPPAAPVTCSTEQLRSLWKVCNGWKASASEGRVYCLQLKQEKDAPVYNLSSSTQPFYNVRLDPTSASAYVTVARHDPAKLFKTPRSESPAGEESPVIAKAEGKNWQQCIATTLEEESRRHPPEDGLVALLMPTPATKIALEKANDQHAVMLAHKECARLVWDQDSSSHYLVHPALATPFCVTIERSPAWSRVEYTMEHHESPQHVAKLTREGSGAGWLEIDTAIASQIESFYLIDVAVTALMLVAAHDEKNLPPPVEAFAPPPVPLPAAVLAQPRSEHGSLDLAGISRVFKQKTKIEAFELDLESQDSLGKGKKNKRRDKNKKQSELDKLPFIIRAPAKIIKAILKIILWFLTMIFKCFMLFFRGLNKCVGSKY